MLAYFLLGRERVQSYSVHEGPQPAVDRVDRAEALAFVKDGFVLGAALLPPLWLAGHGIWLGVLAYALAVGAIIGLTVALALPPIVVVTVLIALHLIIASEADEVLRAHLAARGWTTVGHVTGTGPLDCERRFYDHWLPSMPVSSAPVSPTAAETKSTGPTTNPSGGQSAGSIAPNRRTISAGSAGILGNLMAPLRRK